MNVQSISPVQNISLRDPDLCLGETKSRRIVKPGHKVMISHQSLCGKDNFFRGSAAMEVDLSKFCCMSGQKYGKSFGDPVSCLRIREYSFNRNDNRRLESASPGDGLNREIIYTPTYPQPSCASLFVK